ncbi:hypothetical protein LB507_005322 [Fusarium sp. FIESC RH6]|nr:hypothetical protein LB507_005322 [Fusarium sp. FIESC RH6]
MYTSGYGCVYSAAQGTWRTGLLPTAPSVCEQRLEETQHILLHTEYYSAQFARALIQNVSERDYVFSWLNFNETRFLQIHNNEDLCYQGFEGNPDIYGLGVRLCIYLQWIVALITNNLLPHGRPTHQAAWLIFSIGMCIVAFLASTADYCVFGIEIEILYWVYWGGFACVYASAPSLTRLRGQVKWVALEWSTAIRYTLHILMACHGVWFSWWGYDQAFARMPCGTYQFMLAKFLDPSTSYSYARDFLSLALNMMATPFLLVLSVATVIMALEIKASVQNLASGSNGDESERYAAGLPTRVHDRFLSMTREVYSFVVWLMDPSPGDIRLITPVDVQQRRFATFQPAHAESSISLTLSADKTLGPIAFAASLSIETTLSWNRVTSVHSLTSLGQMLSLIIGMATFISVIWELFKQESKRRQDAKRRRIAPGDTLPQLPLTLSGAIRSAFHQLDEPFLTNAVALPSFKTNPPGSEVLSDNGSYTTGADNRMGLQSSDATWQ